MIKLELPLPPSVNHYWGHRVQTRSGRKAFVFMYLSAEAKRFRFNVLAAVRGDAIQIMDGKLHMELHVYPKKGTRPDVDNYVKPLLDALEHANVFGNDRQVKSLDVRMHGAAAVGDGRLEVTITPIVEGPQLF